MEITSPTFKQNSAAALADQQLQKALGNVRGGFIDKRRKAIEALPEFDRLRDNARDIKDHTLDNLDLYLEAYEAKVVEAGGKVHWAETAEQARAIMLDICRAANARTVTKGKSMITEEIDLNDFLETQRHPAGRDRSRRIHHPAPPRASEPHHRAGRASQQGAGRGRFPARPHASCRHRAT